MFLVQNSVFAFACSVSLLSFGIGIVNVFVNTEASQSALTQRGSFVLKNCHFARRPLHTCGFCFKTDLKEMWILPLKFWAPVCLRDLDSGFFGMFRNNFFLRLFVRLELLIRLSWIIPTTNASSSFQSYQKLWQSTKVLNHCPHALHTHSSQRHHVCLYWV